MKWPCIKCNQVECDGICKKCARCGELEKEHHYNGACYGKCGEYIVSNSSYGSCGEYMHEVEEYLTIRDAQYKQPWTVPYARGVVNARNDVPHILATHCALHVAKSLGKLAAVFEALDHPAKNDEKGFGSDWGASCLSDDQLKIVKAMSADLMTEALRFANLYGFDLETELRKRVKEKNEVDL